MWITIPNTIRAYLSWNAWNVFWIFKSKAMVPVCVSGFVCSVAAARTFLGMFVLNRFLALAKWIMWRKCWMRWRRNAPHTQRCPSFEHKATVMSGKKGWRAVWARQGESAIRTINYNYNWRVDQNASRSAFIWKWAERNLSKSSTHSRERAPTKMGTYFFQWTKKWEKIWLNLRYDYDGKRTARVINHNIRRVCTRSAFHFNWIGRTRAHRTDDALS